jgi:hypothetical protein
VLDGLADSYVGAPFVPAAIHIAGDTLFYAWGNQVSGFNVTTLSSSFAHVLSSAGDIRSLAVRGPYILAADFTDREIWRIPLDGGIESLVAGPLPFIPSGMVYDPVQDRLLLCGWGSNGGIYSVDPDTGADSLLTTTGLGNQSGIVIACGGDVLVSSQLPDQITLFEPTFIQPGAVLFSDGLNNPGGIGYDEYNDVLGIPNTSGTTVAFETVDCTTSIAASRSDHGEVRIHPNPWSPGSQPLFIGTSGRVTILDAQGRPVWSGVADQQGRVPACSLTPGTYLLQPPNGGRPHILIVQ